MNVEKQTNTPRQLLNSRFCFLSLSLEKEMLYIHAIRADYCKTEAHAGGEGIFFDVLFL